MKNRKTTHPYMTDMKTSAASARAKGHTIYTTNDSVIKGIIRFIAPTCNVSNNHCFRMTRTCTGFISSKTRSDPAQPAAGVANGNQIERKITRDTDVNRGGRYKGCNYSDCGLVVVDSK